MDPLQWMGVVRMRIQTADKNITIIHMTPVFWIKYKSSVHNMAFFSEKVAFRREICTDQAPFRSKNSPKPFWTNMLMDFDFSTGGSVCIDNGFVS